MPVKIDVEFEVETHMTESPAVLEKKIREEAALRLARKLINEDLITIYIDRSLDINTIAVRAEVKLIQE